MISTNELRKDYLLDRWVIIAPGRKNRPKDFVQEKKEEKKKICYFCPGNEHLTPPETSRVEENGEWIIRSFPNKFPAVSLEKGEKQKNFLNKYPAYCLLEKGRRKTAGVKPAYGEHEIIVETPKHKKHLEDLSVNHLVKVLDIYIERIEKLKSRSGIEYVSLFKNEGEAAGASFSHTHAQIISLPFVPLSVKEKVNASKKYIKETGICPYCYTWKKEVKSERVILEDENAVAFAPFASRFPFEVWVMPKRHIGQMGSMGKDEKRSFAAIIKQVLMKLSTMLGGPGYNLVFYYAPTGDELHFHLEVCPRISKWAGFELGTGIIINTMSPEDAAGFYRKCTNKSNL